MFLTATISRCYVDLKVAYPFDLGRNMISGVQRPYTSRRSGEDQVIGE